MQSTDLPLHETGTLSSGDVTIFYRVFGKPGRAPVLIMHGANYFDSWDWMEVADGIATDREVCCYDKRGFGNSTWSESKDYSLDAHVQDAMAVVGKLGWQKFIPMGHSASGRLSIAIAANFPDRVAALIAASSVGGVEGAGQLGTFLWLVGVFVVSTLWAQVPQQGQGSRRAIQSVRSCTKSARGPKNCSVLHAVWLL